MDSLPNELLLSIFEELDHACLRACLLTCRRWHVTCERVVYTSPRLSSPTAMDSFARVLSSKPYLQRSVRSLHVLGKANYSSARATDWVLALPGRLAAILPNLRALTLENIESVFFSSKFFDGLERFQRVSELEIRHCRFYSPHDLRNLIYAFPRLTALTLSHVRWGRPPPPSISPESPKTPTRWDRILPLRTLRLEYLSGVTEYGDVFRWFDGYRTVRELGLMHVPAGALRVVGSYLTQMANAGCSLEALTFCPLIMEGADLSKPCFRATPT